MPTAPLRLRRFAHAAMLRPVATTVAIGVPAALWNLARAPRDLGFDPDQVANWATAEHLRSATSLETLVRALGSTGRVAPVVPLMAWPTMSVWPHSVTAALVVESVFYVATATLAAAVATALASARAGVVTGVVCLGTPTAIILARSFLLPPAAATFLLLAVLLLFRSDHGRRALPMAAFGASVGLLLISRVVAAALLPGIVLAAGIMIDRSRAALRNATIAAGGALAVAGPWWLANWDTLRSYIGGAGFGALADELGPANPFLRFGLLTVGGLFMHFRLLLAVPMAMVAAVTVVRFVRGPGGFANSLARVRRHRELVAAGTIIGVGFTVISSTRNMGSDFTYPLLTLLVATVAALGDRLGGRVVRIAANVAVAVAVLNLCLVGQAGSSACDSGDDATASGPASEVIDYLFSGVDAPRHPEQWARAQRTIADAVGSFATRPGVDHLEQTVVGGSQAFRSASIEFAEMRGEVNVASRPPPLDAGSPLVPRILIVIRIDQSSLGRGEVPEDPQSVLRDAEAGGWRLRRRVDLPDRSGDVLVLTHPTTLP